VQGALLASGIGAAGLALAIWREWHGRHRVRVILSTNRAVDVGQGTESEIVYVTVRTRGGATTVENVGLGPDKEIVGIG
jgi:hypothetical protein